MHGKLSFYLCTSYISLNKKPSLNKASLKYQSGFFDRCKCRLHNAKSDLFRVYVYNTGKEIKAIAIGTNPSLYYHLYRYF